MANAIIDNSVVQRLLAAKLETVSGITIVQVGEAEPNGVSAWARFAGMKLRKVRRQRGGSEIDMAELTAGITVVIGESQASGYAAADAAGRVGTAFDGATMIDPSSGAVVHQVDIHETEIELVSDPDPSKGIRTAIVMLSGLAQRWTGTTMETHVT